MDSKKEEDFSFLHQGKEKEDSLKDRLSILINDRSVRQASQDWGIPYSTLNNYLTRGTDPTLKVVQKISQIEKVSLDWLATGEGFTSTVEHQTPKASTDENGDKSLDMWLFILKSLNKNKADELLQALLNKGVDGVLSAIRDDEDRRSQRPVDPIADLLAGVPDVMDDDPDPNAPWVSEENRAKLKEYMIEHGYNRERVSSIIMLFSLPAQEAREILAEYTSGKRASLPQGIDFKGREKKAKGG